MFRLGRKKKRVPDTAFEDTRDCLYADDSAYLHYAAFFLGQKGNFGDRIIPKLAVDLIDAFRDAPPRYRFAHVRDGLTPIYDFAQAHRPEAILIGPGGLICGRTGEKSESGYHWFVNFSAADARRARDLGIPVFFWCTGVNRWSKKRLFTDEIKAEVIEIFDSVHTAFLRGSADIAFLKSFLPVQHHAKLTYQACPSFFIPELRNLKRRQATGARRVAINVSADQLAEYFAVDLEEIRNWEQVKGGYYASFARVLQPLVECIRALDCAPVFFCSTTEDAVFAASQFPDCDRLETNRVSSAFLNLEQLLTTFDFAVGMRLHGWLPFVGMGIPSLFITPFAIRATMPGDLGLSELACHLSPDAPPDLAQSFEEMVAGELDLRARIDASRGAQFEQSGLNVARLFGAIGAP